MIDIIEENTQPRFSDKLLNGFQGGVNEGISQFSKHIQGQEAKKRMMAENEQIKNLTGKDISGIQDPKIRQQIVQDLMKGQQDKANKPDLSGALNAVNTLENLISKEGIGKLGRWNPGSKARFNRGEFQATQAALMPLFKSMFPRGMTEKEFKFVNENYIPQNEDTEQTIKGKIKGLRQLLGQQSGMNQSQMGEGQTERPPLSSFKR